MKRKTFIKSLIAASALSLGGVTVNACSSCESGYVKISCDISLEDLESLKKKVKLNSGSGVRLIIQPKDILPHFRHIDPMMFAPCHIKSSSPEKQWQLCDSVEYHDYCGKVYFLKYRMPVKDLMALSYKDGPLSSTEVK
jgi:hypothetical protein